MLITLTTVALAIGALTALLSLLLPRWSGTFRPATVPSALPRAMAVGLILTAALFALTLPAAPPFSPGLRLGWGLPIGGVLGLIAAWGAVSLAQEELRVWPYPGAFASAAAVVAVSLTLLLFRGDPETSLLGCALGFGMVAGLVRVLLPQPAAALPVEFAGVLAVLLSSACALGLHHFGTPEHRGWWAYPLLLAAAWLLALALSFALSARRGWWSGTGMIAAAGVLATGLVLAAGTLLAHRLVPSLSLLPVLLPGLAAGALIAWLSSSVAEEEVASPARVRAGALAALTLLFLLALTFKLLQAYGTAVALTAAVGVIAVSLGLGWRRAALPVLLLASGAGYLLLRLFLERSGWQAGVEPDVHYTLLGLLLGVLLPFLYVSLQDRPGLGRALALGLLALGSPLVLAALWGGDATVGFLGGLVVAPALAAVLPSLPGPVGLLSVGMALVAVALAPTLEALYLLPRVDKVYLAGALALLVILWSLGLGLLRLRTARLHPQPQEG